VRPLEGRFAKFKSKENDGMSNVKSGLLIGACAVALGLTGGVTQAANPKADAYGGGSSLISIYMVQAFNCYGQQEPLIIRSPLTLQPINPFDYTGNGGPFDCSSQHVNPKAALFFDSAGSGVGIANMFSHDPSSSAPNGYGDIDPNTAGEQDMPYVTYAMSDAGLSQTDVNVWNNGNDDQGPTTACTVPEQKVCVVAPGETADPPTTYPNPAQHYGPMIQFPVSVDPVAFVYDPVYKKVADAQGNVTTYKFNIKFAHTDGSGGLRLDRTTYCTIFNGVFADSPIENWNDKRLTKLNGGVPLMDPNDPDGAKWWKNTGVPLQIAGRGDSSGTTSIFTRHLARVCGSDGINLDGNQYLNGATTLPTSLQGGTYDGTTATNVQLGKFTLANGSNLVAKYVAFLATPAAGTEVTQGNLGYDGADFTYPYNTINGQNTYNLNSADLQNSSKKYVAANGQNALYGFGTVQPPQSDKRGHYDGTPCGGDSSRCRSHPWNWVEPTDKSSPLADPTSSKAYPVVGTTNVILSTCYKDPKVAKLMQSYFKWYVTSDVTQEVPDGLLTKNGLSALPKQWRTAIDETFPTDKSGLGLNISAAGSAGVCKNVSGG
jgi:ABC-type phosphate transport system substrate-binding protein